jgi:hypothetical protein
VELILHIGHEKTGSTSLQQTLVLNEEYLRSIGISLQNEFGVGNARALPAIFSSKIDEFFEDQGIMQSNLEPHQKKIKDQFEDFLKNLPADTKLILSSEHFASRVCSVEEISELATYLNRYFERITIVLFLRNQAALAESVQWENVKSGRSVEIEDKPTPATIESQYFNYKKILENWLFVFPNEIIKVISYDEILKKYNDVNQFFLTLISDVFKTNIDFSFIIKSKNLNKSPDKLFIDIFRHVNLKLNSENSIITSKPWLYNRLLRSDLTTAIENIVSNPSKIKVNHKSWQQGFQSSNNWVQENTEIVGRIFLEEDEPRKAESIIVNESNTDGLIDLYPKIADLIISLHSVTMAQRDQAIAQRDQAIAQRDQIINSRIWKISKIWRNLRKKSPRLRR